MSQDEREPSVRIVDANLRVEFDGKTGPSRLVVPLLFSEGGHRNVELRVLPRSGVTLKNEVLLGDALQTTFASTRSGAAGGSFFASGSIGYSTGSTLKQFDVVYLPDFRGLRFRLSSFDVKGESVGIQLAFPIQECRDTSTDQYFAEVVLNVDGVTTDRTFIPREVHSRAGKVLLASGYGDKSVTGVYPFVASSAPKLAALRRNFIRFSGLVYPSVADLREHAKGYDGIHLYTNVAGGKVLLGDADISEEKFFHMLDGLGIKFVFLDTCNSVQVVRTFRKTDIQALIAATENLSVQYAEVFEFMFYDSLGRGDQLSTAFQRATSGVSGDYGLLFTSGLYDPMFLDLRSDFSFGDV